MSVLGPQAVIHGLGEGEANGAFGLRRWFRVTPEHTGGTFTVFEEDVPEGHGPPLHIHHDAQELFVVLSGRVRFRCSDREAEAASGATVLIPQGAEHAFKALEDSRVLVTLTPGGEIDFFRRVEAEGLKPPQDMARITEIARDYHLEFTGPPL